MSVIDLFLTSLIYMRRLDLSIPAACMSFLASCVNQGTGVGLWNWKWTGDHPRGIFLRVQATDVSTADS